MDAYHDKCQLQKPDMTNFSSTRDILKEVDQLFERCGDSLLEKDKENALLRYQLEQQQQQFEFEIKSLKEKNKLLSKEISQLKEEKQKQLQKNEMIEQWIAEMIEQWMAKQESPLDEVIVKVETLQSEFSSHNQDEVDSNEASTTAVHSSNANTSANKILVRKKIHINHIDRHENASITDDFHRVVFDGFSCVSARFALVPPGARVWYEVRYLPDPGTGYGSQLIGWDTAKTPTSEDDEDASQGVKEDEDSYDFDPFRGEKCHGVYTMWGKTLEHKDGGYVGVAVDTVKGEVLFSINGDWNPPSGVAFSGVCTDTQLFPTLSGWDSTLEVNFGDRDFRYGPPASNFENLADSLC